MKILFVNNFRGRGGGEEFLRDLLPGLAQKGVKVGLVCRPNTPLVELFSGSAVELYPLDRSGIHAVASIFTIAKIIRNGKYEIVSIQRGHDIIQAWAASLFSLRKPILIYTAQVPEFFKSRFFLKRMNAITTISRYIAGKITRFVPSLSEKVSILYYGIDLKNFSRETIAPGWLRNRFCISADTKIIATVGDLWKNQIEFLPALAHIRQTMPETRFALVADESNSPDVKKFKQRADELGVQNAILWAGRLSKEDMLRFYRDVDIAVTTHRNEGFGIWVLEALAMGIPVIGVHAGGIRDSLEDCPAGILVDGDSAHMARAVLHVLTDGSLQRTMGDAGPKWVAERFNRPRMVEDYYEFFGKFIDNQKRSYPRFAKGNMQFQKQCFTILMMISKNDKYGAQRVFVDQASILHSMGNQVVIVGRGERGYIPETVKSKGIKYFHCNMSGFRDIFFLKRLVRDYQVDIIHTALDRADYLGILVSWLTNIPCVSTMNVRRYHTGYRFMNAMVTVSNVQKNLLIQKGIPSDRIQVVRPGINSERYTKLIPRKQEVWKKRLNIKEYSLVLCHISSIIPQKSHSVSIDILEYCKEKGEYPLLVIAGDPMHGEYYESLIAKIQKAGLEKHVYFTGWTTELPEILSLGNFTLLPSVHEAFGIVLLEGMAAGTPIIAREGEGGAELIEDYHTGFLYRPEEGIGALGDKILAVWRNKNQYSELSRKCRATVRDNLSIQKFGEQLVDLYATIIKQKQRGARL
ncbi:MAG: glycosyltransferase family 4 protein [Nitrospirota bacterium]